MSLELKRALERVARRVRALRLWIGLAACWSIWALVGAALLALGVQNVPLLIGLGGLAVVSGIAGIALALRSSRDLMMLARRIEAAHPDLDAGLLTAVEQFQADPAPPRDFFRAAVLARAVEHNRVNDWGRLVPERSMEGARFAHAAALLLLAGIAGLLVRQAQPDGNSAALVTSTELEVTPGNTELEKGSTLLVVARFPGAVPPEARLVVEDGATSREMSRSLDDPTFAGRVESIAKDLAYRIAFPGGQSTTYRVKVFEYPELTRTDATLAHPAYTGLGTKIAEDVRHVTAVEGTDLTLKFRLNKPVASATLVDEKGQENPLKADSATVYSHALLMTESHHYKLRLVDAEGRKNKLSPDFAVNVTRNRPPTIAMTQPGHDVRVSAVEELRLKATAADDFGVIRHGVNVTFAGADPKDVVLGGEVKAPVKKVPIEHMIDFEALKAEPDQLLTYFVWAEDLGPDGKPRRTEGDMFFAEVRHFEEIFRQGEPPSESAQREQEEQQQGGNAQQAEQLAELQKEIINGTWKIVRRETGLKVSEPFAADTKLLRESQVSALKQADAMGQRLRDPGSKANIEAVRKAMTDAIKHLGTAANASEVKPLNPALGAERMAYQALLKLRARESQVTRGSRQQRGSRGGASASQRQLNQLDLSNREDRFQEQSRAQQPASQKEQEQRETRQVLSRLKELAQRQADLNERLKEMQAALEAAKDEQAKRELERQLKRLREQQQEVLRDTDELQERMENDQNRERMAQSREQVQNARDHARQASEALEQGRVSQALNEGTRAGQKLEQVKDDVRKQASNQFTDELNDMKSRAKQLDEDQEKLTETLDARKDNPRPSLRDADDKADVKKGLEQQKAKVEELVDRMRKTVTEAEESEPLLARNLFDAARKADQEAIPQALEQAEKLADAGFADEASASSRRAGEGIDGLREGVEKAARSVLGDEAATLKRAQGEVDDLAKQLEREIADRNGEDPAQQRRGPDGQPREGEQSKAAQRGQDNPPSQQPQPDGQAQPKRQQGQPGQPQQPGQGGQPGQQPGGEDSQQGKAQPQGQAQQKGQGPQRGPGSLRGGGPQQAGDPQGNPLGGQPNGSGGPITGEGFREFSDRMREVEELLEDPNLRAEAARIRDRVRGARDEFKRHAKEPDWKEMKSMVADPIRELSRRIGEEVRRRESPDSLVPIDRDPVPPKFAEGVRRYRERLGSGK